MGSGKGKILKHSTYATYEFKGTNLDSGRKYEYEDTGDLNEFIRDMGTIEYVNFPYV